MVEIVLIIGVLGLAGATAYRVAARLFAGSLVDTLAASLLLFMTLLIGIADGLGMAGLLRLPILLGVLVLLCAILLMLRADLPVLIPASAAQRFSMNKWEALLGAGLIALIVIVIAPPWFSQLFDANISLANNDVVRFEFPNVMHFVQDGTLWSFSGQYAFFPFNYHMMLSWAPLLDRSFALLPYFYFLTVVLVGLYAALLGMWVLSSLSPVQRLLAGLAIIAVILAQRFSYDLIVEFTGKSDLFALACMMIMLYYFVRYWFEPPPRQTGYLALVGIAGGLMVGAKWSSAYWVPVVIVGHLLLIAHVERNLRHGLLTIMRHMLIVGLPVAFFGGIWLIRLINYPLYLEQYYFDLINATSVVKRLDAPQVGGSVSAWLPLALAALVGGLVFILPNKQRWYTFARLIGIAAVCYGFWGWVGVYIDYHYTIGPLVFCVLVFLIPCVGRRTVPHLINSGTFALGILGLLSALLFVFTPQSAVNTIVAHRYNVNFYLAVVVLVVVIAQFIGQMLPPRAVTPMDEQRLRFNQRMLGGGAVALLVIGALFRSVTYRAPETFTFWDNTMNRHAAPTSLFTWVRTNLRDAAILTAEVPNMLLYGDHLENRVYARPLELFTEHKDFWYYTTEEMVAYINLRQIDYVILPVTDFYVRPLPADWVTHTQTMIQGLTRLYPIVFQDEQAVVFATNTSAPLPRLADLRFEFDRLAAPGVYTRGFQRPGEGESFRWVVTPSAQVCANLAPDHDLRVAFKVLTKTPSITLNPLVVSVNGSRLGLARETLVDGAQFESIIRKEILAASPSYGTCLSFDGVAVPSSTEGAYALDWLSFSPVDMEDFWRYDFTATVPSDTTLKGWGIPEGADSDTTFRWTSESESVLTINRKPDQPLWLEFRITSTLQTQLLDELTLEVNDEVVPLTRNADAGAPNGGLFTAFLPVCEASACPDKLTLRFRTGALSSPKELGMSEDTRPLGLMFDWVRLMTMPSA